MLVPAPAAQLTHEEQVDPEAGKLQSFFAMGSIRKRCDERSRSATLRGPVSATLRSRWALAGEQCARKAVPDPSKEQSLLGSAVAAKSRVVPSKKRACAALALVLLAFAAIVFTIEGSESPLPAGADLTALSPRPASLRATRIIPAS